MSIYTPYHSKYLSHKITLSGLDEDAFAKSLTTAKIDMNPHQVEAALFALKSPLSKGVLLADEVGLGKTIEAGIIIAQKWAEHKRRVLLITPASLRKQWQQELIEKFSLKSTILETKTYKNKVKEGIDKPFVDTDGIIIASYEFAANKQDDLIEAPWDIVIFDEAHRLRNAYRKDGAKRAKQLRSALRDSFKILLTATPLQNSLMELYGLVSVIDEDYFGSVTAFRNAYVGARANPTSLLMLKQRLEPICHRMLRRQVQEAGHISFVERNAVTFNFDPDEYETKLYNSVSSFLRRPNTISYGDRTNELVILQIRKILGSSTFAVSRYLENLVARLEEKKKIDTTISDDIDIMDELSEELSYQEETQVDLEVDQQKLDDEIDELKQYLELARSIGSNAKGDKLIEQLPGALDEIQSKGALRKAVIFTESTRTQSYLSDLLSDNGFEGQIVLLNGSNSDPQSRSILAEWKQRHSGTDKISGSPSADMKAAIVEAFREDDKTILISTESGAEGINLQFCSLLVNFDLPWNPQRVEQRIGRCHRYGQQIDVTVINMLNLKNKAEERIYQLLSDKFHLFTGVFGSSDEILGSIERGVDFEKTVLNIIQSARDDQQIQEEFDRLTESLQDKIDADIRETRNKLLESVDEEVVSLLNTRKESLGQTINDYKKRLILIARAELQEAKFHEDHYQRFDYQEATYTTEWPVADDNDWQFFRLSDDNLALNIVTDCVERSLHEVPVEITLKPQDYPFDGQISDVCNRSGQSGWLRVSKATIDTPNAIREDMILSCISDEGEVIPPETADRFFFVPSGVPQSTQLHPDVASLDKRERELFAEFSRLVNEENSTWLDQEESRLDAYAQDLEDELGFQIKDLEQTIKELKSQRRTIESMNEKLSLGKEIKRFEQERDDLVLEQHARRKEIRQKTEDMLDEIAESLNQKPQIETLFTIRWSIA